jgi:hypothetical protein
MILDIYFKRPLFWDYLVAIGVVMVLIISFLKGKIALPEIQDSYSLTGDLTNIALTLIGFILTIVTVLITFKDTSSTKIVVEDEPVFNKFFSTDYYYETVKHLKNCIKSIATIAAFGFFFKLFLSNQCRNYLFFYNVFGLIIIMLTVYRCLLILGKVLELQKTK